MKHTCTYNHGQEQQFHGDISSRYTTNQLKTTNDVTERKFLRENSVLSGVVFTSHEAPANRKP